MDFLDGMLGGGLNSSSAAAAGNANHSNGGINNNSSSNNNGGGRGKMCRSASEMDMEQTSRDQDWRGSAGSASSLKMARTDSYPNLMRTNSVISEANTAANGANSSDLLEESRLLRSDSSAASVYPRACLPVYQQQQQQHQTGSYHQYAANNNRPSGMPLLMGASSAGGAGMGMGMGVGMHSILSCARSPFTAAQWHELEHQALIFKYILAGVQVPSEILIPIRSKVAAATSPMNLFSTLPVSAGSSLRSNLGWSAYHMGFANNADPEPGRCRRTDGKKWRCSRDAVPDQKYCERHMNRGRHRSRKPVEGQTNSAANATSAATATSSATLAVPTAATSSSNNSLTMSQASSSASNLGAAASNPAGLAAVAAAAARTSGLSMVTTHNNNSTAPQSQATNNNNVLGACALGPQQNPQIGGTTAAALSKFASFPSSMASSAAAAPQFQNLDSYVSGLKAGAGAGAGTGAADMETSHIFESSTGLSMMNSSNTAAAAAAWRSRLTAAAAASATYNNSHDTSFLQHQHHQRGDDATDAPGIRHFFDDWPSRSSRDRAVQWPGVAGTQLSISMGSAGGGSPPEKLTLSPLKLSMSGKDDPLEMELGLANDTAEEQRQRVAANWIPITWESPLGGPLAEVLNNTAATGKSREVKSSLNLMTDGWDCSGSPRGDGSRMASPTGVLQKTFGSLSDSSTGSSPRSVVVKTEAADAAAAAAGPLCENIRTASFKLAGATATATATISTS